MTIKMDFHIIDEEISNVMQKLASHYQNVLGQNVVLYLERNDKLIREQLRFLFDVATGKIKDVEMSKVSDIYEKMRELLFRNVYDTYIPADFWATPLGKVFNYLESQKMDARIGQVEAAKYLGKTQMWVHLHWEHLGGYSFGGNKVVDREILERFKKEVLEADLKGSKRASAGYWNSDFWRTPLGQHVKELNNSRKSEKTWVGVNYVVQNILQGKRTRWWVYQHAEELGGIREGTRAAFDEEVARARAKELGIIE